MISLFLVWKPKILHVGWINKAFLLDDERVVNVSPIFAPRSAPD
jgi:hypothetical protein